MAHRRFSLAFVLITLAVLAFVGRAGAEDAPSAIRIAFPGVGVGNRPVVGGSATATMHLKGLLEEEFRPDGIKVTWSFLRGAGPAVNELYANGLVDFSMLGDLPSIVGHASGLRTRVLAGGGIRGNLYIAVPSDSPLQKVEDLRGKRVAIFKGTAIQLSAARILEGHGLREGDIRTINMDIATSKAALTTKDVDAIFGGADLLALRDQGVARILYTTKGDNPRYGANLTFLGSEDFIKKYPSYTRRVLKAYVLAAKWIADHENDVAPMFQLWAKSGVPFSNFTEDYRGESLKVKTSPLIDPYVIAQYNVSIADAKKFGLIRKTFAFEEWVDASFLKDVLKELHLETFWKENDANGTPKT